MPRILGGKKWELVWGRLTACRTGRFNLEGDKAVSMQREEALAEHLQLSRSDSGAAAPATQVN